MKIMHWLTLVLVAGSWNAAQLQSSPRDGQADTSSNNPTPLINQPLVPTTTRPHGADFTLTVNGTGFVSGAVVNWNGSPRTTTFVNASQLTAIITAADIARVGTASVTVVNPVPGGGTSNAVFFPITGATASVAFSRVDFAGGGFVNSVITGDFNGDGRLDLATANIIGSVSILLGNGKGMFRPHVDYTVPAGARFLVSGDFNEDGETDLAVSNTQSPGFVSILPGNGNGTFGTAVSYSTAGAPFEVAAADLNGDGHLDLVTGDQSANTVSVLLGNGDGTFQCLVDARLATGR